MSVSLSYLQMGWNGVKEGKVMNTHLMCIFLISMMKVNSHLGGYIYAKIRKDASIYLNVKNSSK